MRASPLRLLPAVSLLTVLPHLAHGWGVRWDAGASQANLGIRAQDIDVDASGNTYVVALSEPLSASYSFGGGTILTGQGIWMAKYDSAGAFQWGKSAGTTHNTVPQAVAVLPSAAGVVMAGRTSDSFTFDGISISPSGCKWHASPRAICSS
jgi:hypothetical protein